MLLAMAARDANELPPAIGAHARVLDNGEVMWRLSHVDEAIDALAAAGHDVLGLDVRDYRADGSFVDIAWSALEPRGDETDVVSGRDAALSALRRPFPVSGSS